MNGVDKGVNVFGNVDKIVNIETVIGNVLVSTNEKREREIEYLVGLINDFGKTDGVLQYVELEGAAYMAIKDEMGFSKLASKGETLPVKNIWDAYTKYSKFVLLGDPGAGKTTSLRFLAFKLAKECLANPHTVQLPLFIQLSQWEENTTLEEFIRSKWFLEGDPLRLMESGNVLLLLDGINELGDASDDRIKLLKSWLDSSTFSQSVILTCRTAEYSKYKFDYVPSIYLKDLDNFQIQLVAAKYLGDQSDGFLEKIHSQHSLIDLARNPYMLRALTILFELSPDEVLPKNTGALFHRLAQALFQREERRGNIPDGIEFSNALTAFSKLAFTMIDEGKPTEVSESFSIHALQTKWLSPFLGRRKYVTKLLEVGNNANWVVRRDGKVKFYHHLLLEYFAAAFMTFQKKIYFPPMRTTPYGAGNEWIPSRWDQIFIVLSGILEEDGALMDEYIDACMNVNPHLAARCVLSGVSVSIEIRQKLIAMLSSWVLRTSKSHIGESMKMSMIQMGIVPDWIRIYVSLVKGIADENCIEVLVAAIYSGDYMLTAAAAMALGSLGKQGVIALVRILNNEDHQKTWFAEVAAIGLDSVDEPSCVPELALLLDNPLPTPTHSENSMMNLIPIGKRALFTLERIGTPEALDTIKTWKLAQS